MVCQGKKKRRKIVGKTLLKFLKWFTNICPKAHVNKQTHARWINKQTYARWMSMHGFSRTKLKIKKEKKDAMMIYATP